MTTREVPLLTLFIISCPALPLCSPPVATLFSSLYFQISPPENSTSGPLHGVFLGYSSHTQFLILSSQFKCPLSSKSPSAALSEAGPAVSTVIHSHQFSSVTQLCLTLVTPWTAACQASLSITNSQSLFKFISIELVMPSNYLILCCPLLLLPSIFPSIRVFSNESLLPIKWPKHWSFSFSISPSNEYSVLISFRMDWLDLLAVQGTLKSLLQHHSSKASIFRCSAFFMVQFSHPYMTTGKIIALTRWTFVGKLMFLLFNMLSRFVIAFLPRSKHLLISWLQSSSAVILDPPK